MKYLVLIIMILSGTINAQDFDIKLELEKVGITSQRDTTRIAYRNMSRKIYDESELFLNAKELRKSGRFFHYLEDFKYSDKAFLRLIDFFEFDIETLEKDSITEFRFDSQLIYRFANAKLRNQEYEEAIRFARLLFRFDSIEKGWCGTDVITRANFNKRIKAEAFNGMGRYAESYKLIFTGIFGGFEIFTERQDELAYRILSERFTKNELIGFILKAKESIYYKWNADKTDVDFYLKFIDQEYRFRIFGEYSNLKYDFYTSNITKEKTMFIVMKYFMELPICKLIME